MKKILEMKNVSKIYKDVYALSKINFDVYEKEWVSIVGSSGSGKSTLLNIIGCISNASEGTIIFDNQEITQLKPKELTAIRRDKIGFVFQQFFMNAKDTVLNNVLLPLKLVGFPVARGKRWL